VANWVYDASDDDYALLNAVGRGEIPAHRALELIRDRFPAADPDAFLVCVRDAGEPESADVLDAYLPTVTRHGGRQ
jgi:hypothetical protein